MDTFISTIKGGSNVVMVQPPSIPPPFDLPHARSSPPTQPTYTKSPTQPTYEIQIHSSTHELSAHQLSPRMRTHEQEVHGTPRSPRTRTRSIDQKSNFFDPPTNASSSWRTSSIKTPVLPDVRAPSRRQFFLAYELHPHANECRQKQTPVRPATSSARELSELHPLLIASHAEPQPGRPNARRLLLRHLLGPPTVFFLSDRVPELPRFAIQTPPESFIFQIVLTPPKQKRR